MSAVSPGRSSVALASSPTRRILRSGAPADRRPLYHVRFQKGAIWPEAKPDDEILVEIYEHWLEKP